MWWDGNSQIPTVERQGGSTTVTIPGFGAGKILLGKVLDVGRRQGKVARKIHGKKTSPRGLIQGNQPFPPGGEKWENPAGIVGGVPVRARDGTGGALRSLPTQNSIREEHQESSLIQEKEGLGPEFSSGASPGSFPAGIPCFFHPH